MLNENIVPLWRHTGFASLAEVFRSASIESGVSLYRGIRSGLIPAILAPLVSDRLRARKPRLHL
jgi:hypothetical protein